MKNKSLSVSICSVFLLPLCVLILSGAVLADEAEIELAVDFLDQQKDSRSQYINENDFQTAREARKKGKLKNLKFKSVNIPDRSAPVPGQIKLQSAIETLGEIGYSLKMSFDLKNRLQHYQQMTELLAIDQKSTLPSSGDFLLLTLNQQEEIFLRIRNLLNKNIKMEGGHSLNQAPPSYYVSDCRLELGAAQTSYSDFADYSRRCSDSSYSSQGLYKNSNFPLKYHTTCVKSQGARGSCVGFAITAAVEALSYKEKQKAVNLSEQFTYAYAEILGGSSLGKSGRYDYGLNIGNSLNVLDSNNSSLQYEDRWYYNRSIGMEDGPNSDNEHPLSCPSEYVGQMCNDYAFQATEKESGSWPFKTYSYTYPGRSGTKKWEVIGKTSFLNLLAVKNSLEEAKALVNSGTPVIVGFQVKSNFSETDSNGYVKWVSSSSNVGGHGALLIGYVANSALPSGAPHAVGDGYFIMKNSWGYWKGDCGFYYVDEEYLRKTVTGLHTIKVSHPSSY